MLEVCDGVLQVQRCAECGLEGLGAEIVMLASLIAGLWSLMSGTVVVLALQTVL